MCLPSLTDLLTVGLVLLSLFFLDCGYAFNLERTKEKGHLKFIHITKTGGTSIELAGLAKGVKWGFRDKAYGWHHEIFPLKPESYKAKFNWFMVVRNPYSRIISEFHCKWGGVGLKAANYTKKEFNHYVQNRIKNEENQFNKCEKNNNHNHNCWGDHYTEQYKYLQFSSNYDFHILHFENLEDEFRSLMKMYNMVNITLSSKYETEGGTPYMNGHTHIFTEQDIDRTTKNLIDTKYHLDFVLFGYNFILPNL